MTPTLAQALSHIAPAYSAREHTRAAERMVQDMQKNPNTPEFWKDATPIGTDINGRELRAVTKKQDLIYVNGEWKENAVKTAHTPGPWQENEGFVVGPDFETVCDPRCLPPTADNIATMEANARLIAASPDLLAALEEVLRCCVTPKGLPDLGKGRTTEQQEAMCAARAAIAKARGK